MVTVILITLYVEAGLFTLGMFNGFVSRRPTGW